MWERLLRLKLLFHQLHVVSCFPWLSLTLSKDSNNAERGLCCYDQITRAGDEDGNDIAAVSTHHICQTCDTFTCLQWLNKIVCDIITISDGANKHKYAHLYSILLAPSGAQGVYPHLHITRWRFCWWNKFVLLKTKHELNLAAFNVISHLSLRIRRSVNTC